MPLSQDGHAAQGDGEVAGGFDLMKAGYMRTVLMRIVCRNCYRDADQGHIPLHGVERQEARQDASYQDSSGARERGR